MASGCDETETIYCEPSLRHKLNNMLYNQEKKWSEGRKARKVF